MALIGSIEQFTLSGVLGRLETHAKTGLLVIQQGRTWVELYFREGQLMCIGPVRTSANLGERLLQDGVISQQALQETLLAVGADQLDEVSIAITLVNLGHTTKEKLRAWSMQKTLAVLQALLVWTNGDIYFEDDTPTPSGRLLAAFSIASLLAMMPQLETPSTTLPSTRAASYQPEQTAQSVSPVTPTPSMPDITRFRTLMGASYSPSQGDSPVQTPLPESPATNEVQEAPLLSAASLMEPDAFTPRSSQTRDLDSQPLSFQASEAVVESLSAQSLFDDDVLPSSFGTQVSFTGAFTDAADADDEGAFSSLFGGSSDGNAAESNQQANAISFVPPQPISIPVPSRFVDTSYMRPDMILMPLDLSALHTQNTLMALTPEQWRVLTVVDGRTSLQDACRDLSMTPDLLCQVAAELVADQLIQLVPPGAAQAREISPISADVMAPGPGNGYVAPGYAASPAQPWAASVPLTPSEVASQFPSAISFEARSQWGNGGNGASFVPGRGWVASPQPLQPLSPSNPSLVNAGSYVQIGGGRQ